MYCVKRKLIASVYAYIYLNSHLDESEDVLQAQEAVPLAHVAQPEGLVGDEVLHGAANHEEGRDAREPEQELKLVALVVEVVAREDDDAAVRKDAHDPHDVH